MTFMITFHARKSALLFLPFFWSFFDFMVSSVEKSRLQVAMKIEDQPSS